MINIENLSDEGLNNVIMNVSEIIDRHFVSSEPEHGMQLQHTWVTPEGCYWLYKLLSNDQSGILVSKKVIENLKQGTNHPELLK